MQQSEETMEPAQAVFARGIAPARGQYFCDSDDERYLDDYCYYNGDEDDDYDDDESWDGSSVPGTYCGLRPSFLLSSNMRITLPQLTFVTQEEADRNAQELLAEEQRARERADRKRLKKKRQKDRKRQQKLQEAKNETEQSEKQGPKDQKLQEEKNETDKSENILGPKDQKLQEEKNETDKSENILVSGSSTRDGERNCDISSLSSADGETIESQSEDDLDLASTFVRQAQKKMENKPKLERRERTRERTRESAIVVSQERASERSKEKLPKRCPDTIAARAPAPEKPRVSDQIQRSLTLATMGNHEAACERFVESISYYTEAIQLNPIEHRFLGNRSYCYERMGRYAEALQDAERALRMKPMFIKGLFRKGKALKGLQRLSEAIAAFQKVLSVDANHTEAAVEITRCQQLLQQAMRSSSPVKAVAAPRRPPLLPSPGVHIWTNKDFVSRNVGYKREQESRNGHCTVTPSVLPAVQHSTTSTSKLYPVWVGNVTNKMTEEMLRCVFEPFGTLHSMRILYDRTCAFINYSSKDSAEKAFHALQGQEMEGTTFVLQLRNPEHSNLNSGRTAAKKSNK